MDQLGLRVLLSKERVMNSPGAYAPDPSRLSSLEALRLSGNMPLPPLRPWERKLEFATLLLVIPTLLDWTSAPRGQRSCAHTGTGTGSLTPGQGRQP